MSPGLTMGGIFCPGSDTAFYEKLQMTPDLFPNILI